ncbi:MAG: hypothetical protein ACK5RH_09965 [Burkholderiales bacterium]
MSEQFLSELDLAARWAMSSKTLTGWRVQRRGPPFVKLGKMVRYAMSDVLEFERNGLRKPVPRPAAPDEPSTPEVTPDLRIANATLSQLSYVPMNYPPKIIAKDVVWQHQLHFC